MITDSQLEHEENMLNITLTSSQKKKMVIFVLLFIYINLEGKYRVEGCGFSFL